MANPPTLSPDVLAQMLDELARRYAWPPESHFKQRGIPFFEPHYITKDDWLQAAVYTTSTTSGLTLRLRYMTPDGQVHYQTETLDGASTSTLTTKLFPLTEGFLLSASVSNLGGGLADQICFVMLGLQRGSQTSTPPHTVLAQGYVSNLFTVDWPPVYVRGPATSSGAGGYPPDSADAPPASPNAMDDEFTAVALDPKWTWFNQGDSTLTFANSIGTFNEPGNNVYSIKGITQAAPGGSYTVTAKIVNPCHGSACYILGGIVFADPTNHLFEHWCVGQRGSVFSLSVTYWSTASLISAYDYHYEIWIPYCPVYLRAQDDGTNLNYSVSTDGWLWNLEFSHARTTHFGSGPPRVGLALGTSVAGTVTQAFNCDWFRRTA